MKISQLSQGKLALIKKKEKTFKNEKIRVAIAIDL